MTGEIAPMEGSNLALGPDMAATDSACFILRNALSHALTNPCNKIIYYERQLCTLAASNPFLCWDQYYPEL